MKSKRLLAVFLIFVALFSLLVFRLTKLIQPGSNISQAAQTHGSYSLKIGVKRGTIYDHSMHPLVNTESEWIAAVRPQKQTNEQLVALAPHVNSLDELKKDLQNGTPFFIHVNSSNIHAPDVKILQMPIRYSQNNNIAAHIIGYLDHTGKGISGLEKAYNSLLTQNSQTVTVQFPVDAVGRSLRGLQPEVHYDGKNPSAGIVLTIDQDIQKAAQTAAEKYLQTGAVLVMDTKTGDILASVSTPSFNQNNLGTAVKGANSPLMNRAFSAFNVGSVFKINLAAAALELGTPADFSVQDNGSVLVQGRAFHDENDAGYGLLNMSDGMAYSSNVYYITLGQKIGPESILDMATRLGFGKTYALAPDLLPSAGVLPRTSDLRVPAALANFSIGQGNFLATPVQVARMISAVASNGMMPTPRLVKACVDENQKVIQSFSNATPDRVFSTSTAKQLQQFMIATVQKGTGHPALPTYGGAGGKTSTAQTGWVEQGKSMDQTWFAGFYPEQSPRYAIVAMMQNGTAGGTDAGPVFQYIANSLSSRVGYPAVSQ